MNYPATSELWKLEQIGKARQVISSTKSRILARFRQIFPLTIFPDELIIEEKRIIWIQKNAFWSDQVISIMATDIACVNASAGPVFGRVHVKSLTGGPEITLDKLTRNDIYQIRSLVEGIALASREGLHIKSENLEDEKQSLYQAGRVPTTF